MYQRSTELLTTQNSLLLVVDVQEKLMPHIANQDRVAAMIERLVKGAKLANVPIVCSEQYPKGLGSTITPLRDELNCNRLEKLTFSCVGTESIRAEISQAAKQKIVLCGVETHICILQTALDLLAEGYEVYLPTDAVSSRSETDHDYGIRRLEGQGVVPTTSEACLFEWCERAGTDLFSEVRNLV